MSDFLGFQMRRVDGQLAIISKSTKHDGWTLTLFNPDMCLDDIGGCCYCADYLELYFWCIERGYSVEKVKVKQEGR
jgi:hypothetical protein